jgi:hypothetical protein
VAPARRGIVIITIIIIIGIGIIISSSGGGASTRRMARRSRIIICPSLSPPKHLAWNRHSADLTPGGLRQKAFLTYRSFLRRRRVLLASPAH